MSARLRGKNGGEDEWQSIPDEWLTGPTRVTRSTGRPTPFDDKRVSTPGSEHSSQESELTELTSDDETDAHPQLHAHANSDGHSDQDSSLDADEEPSVPANFVEWETVHVCSLFLFSQMI